MMKKIFEKICNFFNPYSEASIDSGINLYKADATKYNLDISHLTELENSISKTSIKATRIKLKLKLKNSLKSIHDQHEYDSMSETIDRAW